MAATRLSLVEQVIRDTQVVMGDEIYHVPSREFYIERIIAYRQEIERLEKI